MLELRFDVGGSGSADLVIASDENRLSIPVLDHTDALADLTAAVVRLAEGSDRAEIAVLDDRHEYVLSFERRGRDGVSVEVVQAEAPRDLDPGTLERRLTSFACTLHELIQAANGCLEAIVRSHGIVGYESMWSSHPFPRELRRRLALAAGRRRRT